MIASLPDVPRMADPGLYELLQAMRRQVLQITSAVDAAAAGGASSGSGGGPVVVGGARAPKSFLLDYDARPDGATSNDVQIANYEADLGVKDLYVDPGDYATARARNAFNKHYEGRGVFLGSAFATPANSGYMVAKPNTFSVQGEAGWFRGDQWFTDGGEWKVIGPGVRDFDLTARYFESNVIPHHHWLDVESGSSGLVGYATGGVTPGNSITLSGAGSSTWVGKQCQINNGFGGPKLAGPFTVASVAGNVVTFTTSHSLTAPWNPPTSAPSLAFAPRTFAALRYVRVRARGGGDIYGDIVRVQIEYQPKGSELDHVFNTMTGAQYGGSVDFKVGTSGTYCTGQESQFNAMVADGAPDVCVRVKVDSLVRDNDRADGGGRTWCGNYLASTGARPSDAANVVVGSWRRAFDCTAASLIDGSYLTVAAGAGAASLTVKWSSGARKDHPITIASIGYTGLITSVAGNVIGISPALPAAAALNAIVDFPDGGASLMMAQNQWVNWDGKQTATGRSADPLGIFPTGWGNDTGVIWSGASTDGTGIYWATFVQDARIRLRPTGMQVNVDILCGLTVQAGKELLTASSSINASFSGAVVFTGGSGNYIAFNTATGKFEFYIASAKVFSIP